MTNPEVKIEFPKILDARAILSQVYGEEAIFVDTVEIVNPSYGIGKFSVQESYCQGHFKKEIGISIFPGHKLIEAAAQTLGILAVHPYLAEKRIPIFQEIKGPVVFKIPTVPNTLIEIYAKITIVLNERLWETQQLKANNQK